MIELLAIWGTILGALAAVAFTVQTSIPYLIMNAENELEVKQKNIFLELTRFAVETERVWGNNKEQISYRDLPKTFQTLNENEKNFESFDKFWNDASRFIEDAYCHVTGDRLTKQIVNVNDSGLKYNYFVSINNRIFEDIDGLTLNSRQKACQDFLRQFSTVDFHKRLDQLYSELVSKKNRLSWSKRMKTVISRFLYCSLVLICLCLVSAICLTHAWIFWSYVVALFSISLFLFLIFSYFAFEFGEKSKMSEKKANAIRRYPKISAGVVACLLMCLIMADIKFSIMPRIIQFETTSTKLNPFYGDESWIPPCLLKGAAGHSVKDNPDHAPNVASNVTNSNSDNSNDTKPLTQQAGRTEGKAIDTKYEDEQQSDERSTSDKSFSQASDHAKPDALKQSINKQTR